MFFARTAFEVVHKLPVGGANLPFGGAARVPPTGEHSENQLSSCLPHAASTLEISRRQFLHLVAGVAVLPLLSRTARGRTYPSRPVRIIVGFPPGGAADITARLMGQWLSERQEVYAEKWRWSAKSWRCSARSGVKRGCCPEEAGKEAMATLTYEYAVASKLA